MKWLFIKAKIFVEFKRCLNLVSIWDWYLFLNQIYLEKWNQINNKPQKHKDNRRPISRPPKSGRISNSTMTSLKLLKSKRKPSPRVSKLRPSRQPLTRTGRNTTTLSVQLMALVKPCPSCSPWSTPSDPVSNVPKTKYCKIFLLS